MNNYHGFMPRRWEIRQVECPECGAAPGKFCPGKHNGASHWQRQWLRQGHTLDEIHAEEQRVAGNRNLPGPDTSFWCETCGGLHPISEHWRCRADPGWRYTGGSL